MKGMLHIKNKVIAFAFCFAIGCFGWANAQTPIQEFKFNNSYTNEASNISFGSNAGTSFTADRFGNANSAININNTGSSATITGLPNGNAVRSVSVWAKINFYSLYNFNFLYSYGTSTAAYGLYINQTGGSNYGVPINATFSSNNALDTWYHFVTTYDGTTCKVYRNGVLVGSNNGTLQTNNSIGTFTIGLTEEGLATYFNGALDDLKIYNSAITASEVLNLYQSAAPISSSLIQEFKFNNSYTNEASNISFGSNAGTSFTSDRYGIANSAININNTGSSATITGLPNGNAVRSVSVWAKLNSYSSLNFNFLYSYGTSTAAYGLYINQTGGSNYGVPINATFSSNNALDTWYHFVTTYDGTTCKVYRNGVLVGSNNGTLQTNNSIGTFTIGLTEEGLATYFNGVLDDLKIYNSAITASEVLNLYQSAAPVSTPLIQEFKFNNSYTNEANNISFASNAGTSFTADRYGNANSAININNTGSDATIPGLPYGNSARTFSVWAKLNTSGASNYLFSYGVNLTNNANGASVNLSSIAHLGFGSTHLATDAIVLNYWNHYVFTYDGTSTKIYKNGYLLSDNTITSWNTISAGNVFKIGLGLSGEYEFNGALDDLRIYNTALNQTDVLSLYQSYPPLPLSPIYEFNFNNTYSNVGSTATFNSTGNPFVNDRFGNANKAVFMNNQGINTNLPALPVFNNSRSISIWVNPSTISTNSYVFYYGSNTTDQAYGFSLQPTSITNFGWANDVVHTVTTPLNTWKHYVLTFNRSTSTVSIYINGVLVKTESKPTWSTGNNVTFYLGRIVTGSSFYGAFDDLKIYAGVLSATDVANLYTTENTMPLTLTNFNGKLQNGLANLNWQTKQEVNTSHFEVEYSTNSNNFIKVKEVAASGNSNNVQSYAVSHEVTNASTHYYRLKMVDKDGKFTYSNVVILKANLKGADVTVYPTIVKNTATVSITTEQSQTAEIIISNMFGQIVKRTTVALNAGTNTQQINVSGYAKGSYIIKVILASESKMVKLIKE